MSTPEDSEHLRALLDKMIRRVEEVLAKPLPEPTTSPPSRITDRLHRAEVVLESAEASGATDKYLRAIAYSLLAIAFELRGMR
jgi:hypothetical protein